MSNYANLVMYVKTITEKGDVFLRSEHGDVYMSPKVAQADLKIGSKVTGDVATSWNEKKQKPGLIALNIAETQAPVIMTAAGTIKWFDQKKSHGYVAVTDGDCAGSDAVLNMDTQNEIIPGQGMPVSVTFMVVGDVLVALTTKLRKKEVGEAPAGDVAADSAAA